MVFTRNYKSPTTRRRPGGPPVPPGSAPWPRNGACTASWASKCASGASKMRTNGLDIIGCHWPAFFGVYFAASRSGAPANRLPLRTDQPLTHGKIQLQSEAAEVFCKSLMISRLPPCRPGTPSIFSRKATKYSGQKHTAAQRRFRDFRRGIWCQILELGQAMPKAGSGAHR